VLAILQNAETRRSDPAPSIECAQATTTRGNDETEGSTADALALGLLALGVAGAAGAAGASTSAGFVYTMSNAGSGNSVIAYARAADGTLAPNGAYPTGGRGTGVPRLGSPGSVVLTADRRRLLVASPGSDDVSVFAVGANGTLTDRESSNGDRPESIAIRGSLVYVLNTGSPNNISGYTLDQSSIVDDLVARGASVRVLDLLHPLSHDGAPPGYLNPGAEYVYGDVRDAELVARCLDGVEAVSHQAAMVGLGADFGDVADYVSHNVLALESATAGTFNVASGEPHTVGELAAELAHAFGGEAPKTTGQYRLGDVRHVFASTGGQVRGTRITGRIDTRFEPIFRLGRRRAAGTRLSSVRKGGPTRTGRVPAFCFLPR